MTNNARYTDPKTYRNEVSREAIIENIDICLAKTFCVMQDRCKAVRKCLTKMSNVYAGSPLAALFKFAWAVNCYESHFVRDHSAAHCVFSCGFTYTHTHTHTHTRWKTKATKAFSITPRGALADNTQTSFLCICIDAGLLARSQYPEGPATGHLDTGFYWFPCVYKRMLRWFPSFQVATTCLSFSTPYLNFLVPYLVFVYM